MPVAARAQQLDRMRRIGVLMGLAESDPEAQLRISAFEQELRTRGWTNGSNLRIDYRWGASDLERARPSAKELLEQRPDVIVAHTSPATVALQHETRTIPIIFVQVTDPIAAGLVATLAHPGGHVTGFTNFDPSLGGKWLQQLKGVAPQTTSVVLMYNPAAAPFISQYLHSLELAASSLSVQQNAAAVRDDDEIDAVMAAMGSKPDSSLIVAPDIFTTNHRRQIISSAARHQLPSIYPFRYWAADGGYVDRILRGEVPSNLPVQQPTKFELVINLKTAKSLGLKISPAILDNADEVLE